MKKIIFVCLGNICRSPMAEFVMKDLLEKEGREGEFVISSAGTSGEHNGESMHLRNVKRCYQNVELKLKKMTDFAKELDYDEVPDPWYSGDFDETYEIISCACKNLIKEL